MPLRPIKLAAMIALCGSTLVSNSALAIQVRHINCATIRTDAEVQVQNLEEISCKAELAALRCDEFFDAESERREFERKCPSSRERQLSGGELGAVCLGQVLNPTIDSIKGVAAFIAAGIKESAENRQKFIAQCEGSADFKATVAKTIPIFSNFTKQSLDKLACSYLVVEFEDNEARQKEYQVNQRAAAAYKQYVTTFRPNDEVGIGRNVFLDFIRHNKEKWKCLNQEGHYQMACYGLFSVVDPTMLAGGVGTGVKGLRLAKLFEKAMDGNRTVAEAIDLVKSGGKSTKERGAAFRTTISVAPDARSEVSSTIKAVDKAKDLSWVKNFYGLTTDDPEVLAGFEKIYKGPINPKISAKISQILKYGNEKGLVKQVKESYGRGNQLESITSNVDSILAESKTLFLGIRHPEVKTWGDFEELLVKIDPDKIDALLNLQGMSNEVREALLVFAQQGKLNEATEIAKRFEKAGNAGLVQARKEIADLRAEISNGINDSARLQHVSVSQDPRAITENREMEAKALSGLKTYRAATSDVVTIRSRFPLLGKNIDSSAERLSQLSLQPKLNDLSELKVEEKLKERLKELDPRQYEAIKAVWNRMNDAQAMSRYTRALAEDAAVEMQKVGGAENLDALARGEVTRNAVLRVLVKRHQAQGNANFSTIIDGAPDGVIATRTKKTRSNSNFREAVGQGPFFDKPFGASRHGVDAHFLQMDYVSDAIGTATKGNPRLFWDLLGSRKGIGYWVPLFDFGPGAPANTFAQPEFLSHELSRVLRITD
jgi:hypothetical protein